MIYKNTQDSTELHYCDNDIYNSHQMISYSQEGEDIILRHLFPGIYDGFYVDIGAHHPVRFSNTLFFYNIGWSGINIDPLPGIMDLFRQRRPRDINLEIGISDTPAILNYHMFDEPAVNSFDEAYAKVVMQNETVKYFGTTEVQVLPLRTVLEEHAHSRAIDFMNIDTEEFELRVLSSNDWDRFRPKYIIAESLSTTLETMHECPIYSFLSSKNYVAHAKTIKSFIYMDRSIQAA